MRKYTKETYEIISYLQKAYRHMDVMAVACGETIPLGADYSQDTLHTKVEDIIKTNECPDCEGRGWNIYNTSPDGDKDICHQCWGTKYSDL